MSGLLVIIGIIAVIAMWVMGKYNGIIVRKNKRDQAFSDIDVSLKQRFDMIPQLLETVKGYMSHERETLESLTKARTSFMNASTTSGKIAADNMLSGALKSLFAVAENYPDLKASENFQQLQNSVEEIENKLAGTRNYFNETTTNYNTYIQQVPTNFIANMFGFMPEKLFQTTETREELDKTPEIKF